MKTEETKQLTEEENKAWEELWQFANQSIGVVDGIIDKEAFIEQGKKRFIVNDKIYSQPTQ